MTELQKRIQVMASQHCLEAQKLQEKIYILESKNKQQAEKFKDVSEALRKEKHQVFKLKDIIEELRKNEFISPEDEKFLIVSLKEIN